MCGGGGGGEGGVDVKAVTQFLVFIHSEVEITKFLS